MFSFQIWDGKKDIFFAGQLWSADEIAERYPWVNEPGKVAVIASSSTDGGELMELAEIKAVAAAEGVLFTDDMAPEEILNRVADYMKNHFPCADAYSQNGSNRRAVVTAEDRMAAAAEAQLMLKEPDAPAPAVHQSGLFAKMYGRPVSPGLARIRNNFMLGLWSESLVRIAVQKGRITAEEADSVLGYGNTQAEENVVSIHAFG